MGAGAFIMASYTGIPYGTIVAVAVVPALLYFLSVGLIVRIEAVKHAIGTDEIEAVDRKKLLAGLLNFVRGHDAAPGASGARTGARGRRRVGTPRAPRRADVDAARISRRAARRGGSRASPSCR